VEEHHRLLARLIKHGAVVPFLGAGVNLCGRGPGAGFRVGESLPSGQELADYLAHYAGYRDPSRDLVRVSQHFALLTGPAQLYDVLHDVFDHDYPPTGLHRFLAELPGILEAQGTPQHQLICTTNYDDALERSFEMAGEPVDVVIYLADGADRGKFLHRAPDGSETVVEVPNKYEGLSLTERSVIVKIHGAVDRDRTEHDSYVITEDHYIDYLTRTDISNLVPVSLAAKFRKSHFLFLGYSLKDWNLRVILHRLWGSQKLRYRSWAVQLDPDPIDRQSWAQRDVEMLPCPLEDYIEGLRRCLDEDALEASA